MDNACEDTGVWHSLTETLIFMLVGEFFKICTHLEVMKYHLLASSPDNKLRILVQEPQNLEIEEETNSINKNQPISAKR